jgi:hypothetical protein
MFFGRGQGSRDLFGNIQRSRDRQWSIATNTRFQRFAFHQLHCVKTLASWSFAKVKYSRDIRVSQLSGSLCFAPETLARPRICGVANPNDLKCDR